jgi:hypothetical protein
LVTGTALASLNTLVFQAVPSHHFARPKISYLFLSYSLCLAAPHRKQVNILCSTVNVVSTVCQYFCSIKLTPPVEPHRVAGNNRTGYDATSSDALRCAGQETHRSHKQYNCLNPLFYRLITPFIASYNSAQDCSCSSLNSTTAPHDMVMYITK